jgi:hypothetical protein
LYTTPLLIYSYIMTRMRMIYNRADNATHTLQEQLIKRS